MSTEFEQSLSNLKPRRKIELEVRLRYNNDTGEIIDWRHVDRTEDWQEPYIVISDDTQVHPLRQRVKAGKIVDIDTSIHVYWQATPAETIRTNPYFCKREL